MQSDPQPRARILIVDDEVAQMNALRDTLGDNGYETTGHSDARAALEALRETRFDVLLSDLMMPGIDGIALLKEAQRIDPDLVGIIMTGQGTIATAVEAMKTGAFDYVLKPFKLSAILPVLSRALVVRALRLENVKLQEGMRKRTVELEAANREIKEKQAQLVQSEKMASLGQLVAGVAHEINNPLAFVINHHATIEQRFEGIVAELEPLLSERAAGSFEKIRTRLGDARAGLRRIADLVVDLRTFSRLDEGHVKSVSVDECIDSVLRLLQYKIGTRIRVTKRYGDSKVVECYPGPLNQVFMNVIANAVEAIEGDGAITIGTQRRGPILVVSIADTGKGIPPSNLPRVLDPFFTTKPVGEGTGLGLYISYGIVEKHDGALDIESVEGEGTTVTIRLPVERPRGRNVEDR